MLAMAEADGEVAVRDPNQVISEIETTRENLARTLDALTERVRPRNRGLDVTDRLRWLGLAARLARGDPRAGRGDGHVDNIAEGALGVVGDADRRDGAVNSHPLVFCGVAQFSGNGHDRYSCGIVGVGQVSVAGGRTAGR